MTETRDDELPSQPAELLQWSIACSERETAVTLVGEVDLSTADVLSRALEAALQERPTRLAVDVARVSFLDSTGIRCLLAAQRGGSEMGCKLVVRHPTAAIARVFEICAVDKILLEHVDRKATESLAS